MGSGGIIAFFVGLAAALLICGVIGALIGQGKDRAVEGLLLGLFLGLIGVAITIFLSSATPETPARPAARQPTSPEATMRRCPWCIEPIQIAARVCKHCRQDVAISGWDVPPTGTPKGWFPDPSRRYPDRWWNGHEWTRWTRDRPGGTRFEDQPYTLA